MAPLTWTDRLVILAAAFALQPFIMVMGKNEVYLPYSMFECTSYDTGTNYTSDQTCYSYKVRASYSKNGQRYAPDQTSISELCTCQQWHKVEMCSVDETAMNGGDYLGGDEDNCGENFAPRYVRGDR